MSSRVGKVNYIYYCNYVEFANEGNWKQSVFMC